MISVTILTKNSEETLKETLDSLRDFPEVIVLDNGSTDGTLNMARSYPNVVCKEHPFLGFGQMHNLASSYASYDWILSIDSDEVLSKELRYEIIHKELDPKAVYAFLRHNYFNGKRIKWCGGWHPDWVVRLYNRKTTRFTDDKVHEKVLCRDLRIEHLKYPVRHTPYRKISDFLDKMQSYSTLFAKEHASKKSSSFLKALFHGWFAFIKSYIFKRGFLGGKEGFIISLYNGQITLYKYLKLVEENTKK
jgi:glycosyltransferase involved in cell wall biosynthesis